MDVKPLNIALDAQGDLHLLDMGSFQPLGRKIAQLMVTFQFAYPAVSLWEGWGRGRGLMGKVLLQTEREGGRG
jgi:hypothetical protein